MMMKTAVRIGTQQMAIIGLTLATALIHIWLNIQLGGFLFILNGLGYLALLAAYFLQLPYIAEKRAWVRYAFLAYTAVTIIGWIFIGSRIPLAYVTKAIEVVLIVLLLRER